MAGRGATVASLTWMEVGQRLATGATAVLPVGAAAKEHGLHLPMDTDFRTAEHLGARLAEREHVLVWPTVGYGHYPAFVGYAGSVSLSRPTFEAVVREVLDDVLRAGARRVLVLNTGISTIGPVDAVRDAHEQRARIARAHVYRGERYLACVATMIEQERGGHADEAETSILMVVAPDAVRTGATTPWTPAMIPGPFQHIDPAAPNYAPAGHFGDPTRATRKKGEALIEAMLADVAAALQPP